MMVLLGLGACAAPHPETVVTREGRTLTISGPIARNLDRSVVRELRGIDTVTITSSGGDERAAVRIGMALADRPNIMLIVEGACLSACAQYIFVAAQHKRISEGGVVGCHVNAIAGTEVSPAAYGSQYSKAETELAADARRLYRYLGVSISFARVCMSNAVVICYYTDPQGNKGIRTTVDIWIPTSENYRQFGIAGVEGAPETNDQARALGAGRGLSTLPRPNTDEQFAGHLLRRSARHCDTLL